MKQSKKKKRSRAYKKGIVATSSDIDDKKDQILKNLLSVFTTLSLEEATEAYKEANGDPNKAAEILAKVVETASQEDLSTICSSSSGNYVETASQEDLSTICSSSSGNYNVGSSSSSSDVYGDVNDFLFKQKSKPKVKRVIAAAGTVSTVLGKDYVRSTPQKGSSKLKGLYEECWNKEESEQFLHSMLGEECELSLAVVGDVLCQCGYNLEKALDVLLELSAPSKEQTSGCYEAAMREDAQDLPELNDSLTDRSSDSNSHSSEIQLKDNVWFTGNLFRNLQEGSGSGEFCCSAETGDSESELPQKLLESLFNMPTPKSAEHEPNTMNWRNVVKKMTSLGQRVEPRGIEQAQLDHAKGSEYQVLRTAAKQHWVSMKSYYHKAAIAYTNGEKEHATYLSEQGRLHNKKAREADEKASQDIFSARNISIENVITIDLHGQHVKQAMRLLKLHILFGAYVRSVRSFKVITGCGTHGVGKSKVKTSVIKLLKKEGITWSEENRGMLLIKLDGQTDFSFLDSGSESD